MTGGKVALLFVALSGLIVPRDRTDARYEALGESSVAIEPRTPSRAYRPFIRPRISDIMLSRSASAFARSLIN